MSADLRLIPLPARGPDQPGLCLMPAFNGLLDVKMQLFDDIAVNIRTDLKAEGGIALLMRPGRPLETVVGFADESAPVSASGSIDVRAERTGLDNAPTILLGSPTSSRLQFQKIGGGGGVRISGDGTADLFAEIELKGLEFRLDTSESDGFISTIVPGNGIGFSTDLAVGVSNRQRDLLPRHVQPRDRAPRPRPARTDRDSGADHRGHAAQRRAPDHARRHAEGDARPADRDRRERRPHRDVRLPAGPRRQPRAARSAPRLQAAERRRPVARRRHRARRRLPLRRRRARRVRRRPRADVRRVPGDQGDRPDHHQDARRLEGLLAADRPVGRVRRRASSSGFGFTLLAVGGIIGLNRTMNLDALLQGVRTGGINSVMFPKDVIANAPRIISDLRAFFPPRGGHLPDRADGQAGLGHADADQRRRSASSSRFRATSPSSACCASRCRPTTSPSSACRSCSSAPSSSTRNGSSSSPRSSSRGSPS